MTHDLILGTAGHIDHGKTALIRALTGTETDRLPEEKKRGITIELGFAELQLENFRLGVVDVPGHEKFVRQMLAGATGMDLGLLVIAADDSIKQQTREHFEILQMLDLSTGVIAMTKVDLVDDDWLELVEEEIHELVAESPFAEAPLVRVSAKTGVGLEELKKALLQAAQHAVERDPTEFPVACGSEPQATGAETRELPQTPFRMAIDRTFTLAGHGTVVTGSVTSGSARIGDTLEIQPGRISVRVRQLQNHARQVDEVHRGQRAAINLSGIHHNETERGQELATPGFLRPSRLLNVQLQLLPHATHPLKDRRRVRLHLGTDEILCTVRLWDPGELLPGDSAPAQLFLEHAAVATWHQPFVLRSESPVETIGGGKVLHPHPPRIKRLSPLDTDMLSRLADGTSLDRAAAALYYADLQGWDPAELPRTAGTLETDSLLQALKDRGELVELQPSPTRLFRLHTARLEELAERVINVLDRLHERFPLRPFLPLEEVQSLFEDLPEPALFELTLEHLQRSQRLQRSHFGVALTGRGPQLSQNEQKLLGELIEWFRAAGLTPPTVAECRERTKKNKDSVPQLIDLAVALGDLVEIAPDFYLHRDVEAELRQQLIDWLQQNSTATLADLRDVWQTSRKYAVPLAEHYDRSGLTAREGDLRKLANTTV